ncbi:tyrosine-type recombinase/integrase [Virgibacillus natechei]
MYCKKIKTKSGQVKWECVADGPRNPATGKRNQITRRGKTQKESKSKVLAAVRGLEENGIDSKISGRLTFDAVAQKWYESYKATGIKDSTLLRRRKEINILNKHVAKTPIGEITHYMYQEVIYIVFPDYARNTVKGIHSAANLIFKYAKKNKWIKENPAIDAVVPKKQKTVEEIKQENIEEKYLDHEELEEFLLAVAQYGKEYDLERFYTLAFSGMRPGELCALQKQDLLFETNEIDITKTLYNEKNNMREYELTPPKTYSSVREVAMEPMIMDMLKKVVLKNDKRKMKYRGSHVTHRNITELYHDKDFVFARKNGYPFSTIPLNVRMNELLKRTNIKKAATPHIFRHTHVSMLSEAGADIPTIMKRVGHDDSETTMKIYTHVTSKMKKEAPEKITNLYGNILEKIPF